MVPCPAEVPLQEPTHSRPIEADNRDATAEASERLRHLAPNRSGADDDQPARQLGQLEERLVCEEAGVGQAGNRRRRVVLD
jgi:hypothetical protein